MTVWRDTELPRRPARGRLVVPSAVATATIAALREFRGSDGRHEGLLFWCGRTVEEDSYVLTAVLPRCAHRAQGVQADERAIGRVARAARASELGLIAQVHSHPGDDTRHSDGDDRLVFCPFEGMFSLVVADYGDGSVLPKEGSGLHQFQDGRWVYVDDGEHAMVVVPELIDARG